MGKKGETGSSDTAKAGERERDQTAREREGEREQLRIVRAANCNC